MKSFLKCKKDGEIVPLEKVEEICSPRQCPQLKRIRKSRWPRGIPRKEGWLATGLWPSWLT